MKFKKGDYIHHKRIKKTMIILGIVSNPFPSERYSYRVDIIDNTNQKPVHLSASYIESNCKRISKNRAMAELI